MLVLKRPVGFKTTLAFKNKGDIIIIFYFTVLLNYGNLNQFTQNESFLLGMCGWDTIDQNSKNINKHQKLPRFLFILN